jgi:hypothetical protein
VFALLPVVCIACQPPASAPLPADADTTTGADMSLGTGEAPVCLGPPEDLDVAVKFDGLTALAYPGPVQLDLACVVRSLGQIDEEAGFITLDCDPDPDVDDPRSIELRLDRPLRGASVVMEQPVRLRVQIRGGGDDSIFLAVHDSDGELALAYANASALPGDDSFAPADFFAPLTLAPVWPCPVECPGFDGLFVVSECNCFRRGALDFSHDGRTVRVDDHGVGQLPEPLPYDLRVIDLRALERESCEALAPDDSGVNLRFFAARMR